MTAAGAVVWTVIALGAPPLQQPTTPPPPTGLIVGRVVDGSSGRPIAGVVVAIDGGGASIPGSQSRPRALTNGSGQFVFRKLAKGTYHLTATRVGYVDAQYGQRRPGGSSSSVPLDEGQRVGDVVMPMWKYAVVTGTVVDEAGEPVIGVAVRPFRRQFISGKLRIVPGNTASTNASTTDDRGMYRLSLIPGDYIIAFVAREASMPTGTADLLRGGPSTSDPKIDDIMNERFALGIMAIPGAGSTSGIQVGGLLRDLPQAAPVPPPGSEAGPLFVYPTQFYPGVPSARRARAMTLGSGDTRDGVDFTLRPVRTSRVSGAVVGLDGPLANVGVRLVPANDDEVPDLNTSVTMTGPGGEFTLLGVPSGQYMLRVVRVPRVPESNSGTTTMIQVGSSTVVSSVSGTSGGPPRPIPDDPTQAGEVPIAVADADVTDVLVTLQRAPRVTGRFEFDGTHERPDATALTHIAIMLDRADGLTSSTALGGIPFPAGRADESGHFKTYGVPPGRYIVRVPAGPVDWSVRSISSDGRDLTDVPVDLRGGDLTNVVVTFTDHPTKLSGIVRTGKGSPDPDALVVVFSADAFATTDASAPRRTRSVRPERNGSYSITGLPSGDYYVAAIHEETVAQWQDPQTLEELSRGAAQVRLGDGDTRTQDLKSTGGRQ